MLEDPNVSPPDDMWTKTVSPLDAPDKPEDITVHFEKGIPVKVEAPGKTTTDSVELFGHLNDLGNKHGVGRIGKFPDDLSCLFNRRLTNTSSTDIVENRYEDI